jgi:hypothetical protein
MDERWLPVVGYEGKYEVSSEGRLRRCAPGRGTQAGRIKAHTLRPDGYFVVGLPTERRKRTKTFLVHRLVAAAFLGAPPPGREGLNHIDGVKTNNRVENLEYVTQSENVLHAYRLGLRRPTGSTTPRGEAAPWTRLRDSEVEEIRARVRGGESQTAIARRFRCTQSHVSRIVSGQVRAPAK